MDHLGKVLRQPNFFRLWFGQVISSIGDRFYQCALLSLVLGLNQGTQIGKESARIIFIGMIPGLIFAPLLGWVVDRFNRKATLVFADLSRVLLVFLLIGVWFQAHNLALVYVLVFFIGGMNCLFIPARQAVLPQIVSGEDLIAANALISLVGVIASLVGTLSGGLVASIFGARASFFITMFGFAVSAYFILRIKISLRPEVRGKDHPILSAWQEIAAGWNYVRNDRPTQWLIVLSTLFMFVTGFFMISVLEFAVRQLDLVSLHSVVRSMTAFFGQFAPKPPVINIAMIDVGLLMGALGIGLGLGSLISGSAKRWTHRTGLPFISFFIVGVVILIFAQARSYSVALGLCVLLGCASALFTVPVEARLQSEIPNACRGRVFALRNFCTSVAFLVALAFHLSGELLRASGPYLLIEELGGGMMVVALILAWGNRRALATTWGKVKQSA